MLGIWNSDRYTKTTGIIFHLLDIQLDKLLTYGYELENAYIDDYEKEKNYGEDCVYVRVIPRQGRKIYPVEAREFMYMYQCYVDCYTYNSSLVFVMRVPKKYKKDYEYFKQGKYSKMNKEIAKIFPKTDIRYHVLMKTEELRLALEEELSKFISVHIDETAELADIPHPEKEVLRYFSKDLIKYDNTRESS